VVMFSRTSVSNTRREACSRCDPSRTLSRMTSTGNCVRLMGTGGAASGRACSCGCWALPHAHACTTIQVRAVPPPRSCVKAPTRAYHTSWAPQQGRVSQQGAALVLIHTTQSAHGPPLLLPKSTLHVLHQRAACACLLACSRPAAPVSRPPPPPPTRCHREAPRGAWSPVMACGGDRVP